MKHINCQGIVFHHWCLQPGGILSDMRRLNVALTRAKHKLVLVGCIPSLRPYRSVADLLDILDPHQVDRVPWVQLTVIILSSYVVLVSTQTRCTGCFLLYQSRFLAAVDAGPIWVSVDRDHWSWFPCQIMDRNVSRNNMKTSERIPNFGSKSIKK